MRIKGGLPSTASRELLLALQPSPLALTPASLLGIPAVAEPARRPVPEAAEHLGERGKKMAKASCAQ